MKKYDYKVEQKVMHNDATEVEDYLKEMNKNGWRFVQVESLKNTSLYYFEKEIINKNIKK